MPAFEHENRLRELRAESWEAFCSMLGRTNTQAFSAAAEVYERELRVHLDADDASDRDYAQEIDSLLRARRNVHQMIDAAEFGTPEHYGLQMILADLNAVLGPDLLREADPTGRILKELPFEERKRMLDALDSAQKLIEERGGEMPPKIIIVEDELGPLMEKAQALRATPQEQDRLSELLKAGRAQGVFVVTEEEARRFEAAQQRLATDPEEQARIAKLADDVAKEDQ